jgi:hypothetical protein
MEKILIKGMSAWYLKRNREGRRERGRGKSFKSPNYYLLALYVCELMVAVRQRKFWGGSVTMKVRELS